MTKYEISADMMSDIARELNNGATWAEISRAYGIPPQSIKRAYLRKSREVYGNK
jgi:DNA-binding IscR family transcriptional regulator